MKIIQVVLTILFTAMAVTTAYKGMWFDTYCFSAFLVAMYIFDRPSEIAERLHEETLKQQDRMIQTLFQVYRTNLKLTEGKDEQEHSDRT